MKRGTGFAKSYNAMMFKAILLIFTLPILSFGQWTNRAQNAVEAYNGMYALSIKPKVLAPYSTPILNTAVEVIRVNRTDFGKLFEGSRRRGGLYFDKSKIQASSLTLLFPGIFMSAEVPPIRVLRRHFLDLRRDVISVSNPMHPERIVAMTEEDRPFLIDPSYEASRILTEVQFFIKDYKRIDIVGHSYGSFIAVEMARLLKSFVSKEVPVTVTILYPPLNLRNTLQSFENSMKQWKSWGSTLKTLASFDLSPAIGNEHQGNLARSLGYLDDRFKNKFMQMTDDEYSKYVSQLTFFEPNEVVGGKSLIETYAPEFLKYINSEKASLYHHLPGLSGLGVPVRVISSRNDFINDPKAWSEVPRSLATPKNLLLLEGYGSHRMDFTDSIDLSWSTVLSFGE